MSNEILGLLSEYLKLDTTNPPGNEERGVCFFEKIFSQEGIEYKTYQAEKGRSSIRAIIPGSKQREPLVLLNHIDVVLAEADQWEFDPFSGKIEEGFMLGRGALDMKGLAIIQLKAFLEIHRNGVTPNRDIIFLATADEEEGGKKGLGYLLSHYPEDFRAGLVLNEGGYGVIDLIPGQKVFLVSTAEKGANIIRLTCQGSPGHGSAPHGDNAVEKLIRGINRIIEKESPVIITPVVAEFFMRLSKVWYFLQPYRDDPKYETLVNCLEQGKLTENPQISAMIRNTISCNVINAGAKVNVIPGFAEAYLDVRILPGEDPGQVVEELENLLDGYGVRVELTRNTLGNESPLDTADFEIIKEAVLKHYPDAVVVPSLLFGSSDSRYFRDRGVTAYGFCPFLVSMKDIKGVHGINEKISVDNLIKGAAVFQDTIKNMSGL